jgi:hypothetical protein
VEGVHGSAVQRRIADGELRFSISMVSSLADIATTSHIQASGRQPGAEH